MTATVLGLNAVVEATYVVGSIDAGVVVAQDEHLVFAGKATTVARVAVRLGSDVSLVLAVPEEAEDHLAALAESGIRVLPVFVDGRLRTSVVVAERDSLRRMIVRSVDQAPAVTFPNKTFEQVGRDGSANSSVVAFAGSVPDRVDGDMLVGVLSDASSSARQVVVDTSGRGLHLVRRVPDLVLEVNQHELADVSPDASSSEERLAADLLAQGSKGVIVTAGSQGARLYDRRGSWGVQVRSPRRRCVGAGSGDAMMAGVVHALDRGQSLGYALRLGTAIGAQSAASIGSGTLSPVTDPLALVGPVERLG